MKPFEKASLLGPKAKPFQKASFLDPKASLYVPKGIPFLIIPIYHILATRIEMRQVNYSRQDFRSEKEKNLGVVSFC